MVLKSPIAVVVPSYKVETHIFEVIKTIPEFVDFIIVVDDKCPNGSGNIAKDLTQERLVVVFHEENQGVGGATVTGYKKALELGCDIVVKIDGDGQMDPAHMRAFIQPLLDCEADYCKGNRFRDFNALRSMPPVRLFGNSALSFLVKVASGYWNIMDPTNGYTAIHRRVLERMELDKIAKRYFFESDMLIRLNIAEAVVRDISIPARYGDEQSSLSVRRTLVQFPGKLAQGFVRRIILKYFIYDFNMASIYLIFGVPMFVWGFGFGAYRWFLGAFYDMENSTGTVMLSVLPLILSVQFLIAAVGIDIHNTPKRPR